MEASKLKAASPDDIDTFLDKLKSIISDKAILPHFIWNYDESGIALSSSNEKVFVPRSQAYGVSRTPPKVPHMSFLGAISADGKTIKPSVILKTVNLPKELEDLLDDYSFGSESNGWITAALFETWISKIFIPHLEKKRRN